MKSSLSIIAVLASLVLGQMHDDNSGVDNSSTPTTTMGDITIHQVTVGHVMNSFQPNSIQAKPGDIVQFTFHASNHSVIRAPYGYPCIPYEAVLSDSPGFYSGISFVNDTGIMPTWELRINNTDPIFFYCGTAGQCATNGMIGVINANNNTDLSKQIALAKKENYQLMPTQSLPAAAVVSLAAIAATATAASATATSSTTNSSSSNSISISVVAATAVAACVLILIAAVLFFFLGRAHGRRQVKESWDPAAQLGEPKSITSTPTIASPHIRSVVSPEPTTSRLPAYATTEAKSPYVVEHGIQQPGSPHIIYTQHSGFVDHEQPRPLQTLRRIEESELDGGSINASRSSPGYGRIQELDGHGRQRKQDYF